MKICGLREPEHAVAAARHGADLLGFVFAPSKRRVTPDVARRCVEAAKAVNPEVRAVGVFVDADAAELETVAREAGLDLLQLHGDERPELLRSLTFPTIRAVRPSPEQPAEKVLDDLAAWSAMPQAPQLYLVDAYSPTAAGGTGERADWVKARAIAAAKPILLAGGLDPDNVGEAVATVRPAGVDVSSGVERGGMKDVALIAAFIEAARGAVNA